MKNPESPSLNGKIEGKSFSTTYFKMKYVLKVIDFTDSISRKEMNILAIYLK